MHLFSKRFEVKINAILQIFKDQNENEILRPIHTFFYKLIKTTVSTQNVKKDVSIVVRLL